jgi:hypothetical protein
VKVIFKQYNYGWCSMHREIEVCHSLCLLQPTDVFAEAWKMYWRPCPVWQWYSHCLQPAWDLSALW